MSWYGFCDQWPALWSTVLGEQCSQSHGLSSKYVRFTAYFHDSLGPHLRFSTKGLVNHGCSRLIVRLVPNARQGLAATTTEPRVFRHPPRVELNESTTIPHYFLISQCDETAQTTDSDQGGWILQLMDARGYEKYAILSHRYGN